MPRPIVQAYYSDRVIRRRSTDLIFFVAIGKICVPALVCFLPSVLAGGLVCFSTDLTGLENIAARRVLFSLPKWVHNSVKPILTFRTISDCYFNPVKAYPVYMQSPEVNWLVEEGVGRYSCNAATEKLSSLPSRYIRGQKWAADASFITNKVGEAPVRRLVQIVDEAQGAQCCRVFWCSAWWACSSTYW